MSAPAPRYELLGELATGGMATVYLARQLGEHGFSRIVAVGRTMRFGRLVGESRAMRLLFPVLERVAASDDPVLLEGEPGTGKELLAEELHALGARRDGPFVAFDAGHAAGESGDAATMLFDGDASLWRQAHGGTLYIAEIGDLSPASRARLVTALEGETSGARRVRVVAATRRDLDRDIDAGTFDERLFYLLAPGRIELPPLRDREGDVALLAEREWRALAGQDSAEGAELPADFMVRYEGYPFPGNLDELKAAVLARYTLGGTARAHKRGERRESAPDYITDVIEQDLPFPRARELVTTEFERRYVRRVLDQNGGNVRKAAEASGVAHRYFQLVHARVR